MVKIYLNGTEIAYKPDFYITEEYSEALDTGKVIIPQVALMSIEPFDVIKIEDTAESYTKYMCVSSVHKKVVKWSTPKLYDYDIGLVSNTIRLQRIILPNRSITQSLVGTNKTIKDVLFNFVNMYAPNFTISTALSSATEYVTCPEMKWERPTLFEVFNDLLAVINACVTMTTATEISYLPFNLIGSEITDSDINGYETEQSIEDYANTVEMDASNVVSNQRNAITTDWISVRTTQGPVLTTKNAEIIVEKPIYEIKSITARWNSTFSYDITDYCLEKKEYDLLKSSNSATVWLGDGYKRHYIYFEEGSNVIKGLCDSESTWFLGADSGLPIITRLNNMASATLSAADVFKLVFKIYYTTIEGVKFTSEKEVPLTYDSALINGQDSTYVNMETAAKKQQQTVNRLGNPEITIYGKYSLLASVPSLADYYDTDYILSKRTISFGASSKTFTGVLTKNYVKKYLFTGLNSRKRYTQLLPANEAFICNHLTKIKLQFSFTNASTNAALENHLLKFGSYFPIKCSLIRTHYTGGTSSTYIGLAGSAFVAGKSLVYNFRMQDNFTSAMCVEPTFNILGVNAASGMSFVPYVDSRGEFIIYDVTMFTTLDNTGIESSVEAEYNPALQRCRAYPEISSGTDNAVYQKLNIFRYKDNREIMSETYQFFIKGNDNIFVTDKFYQDSPLTCETTQNLRVRYAFNTYYDETSIFGVGNNGYLKFDVTRTNNYIEITPLEDNGVTEASIVSWGITDINNKLYIGVNSSTLRIYLNKEND